MMSTTHEHSPPSRMGRVTRWISRMTGPMSRPLAGRRFFPLWAIVHHRGRRSGQAYAIPVAVRASADAFVIALPWGERTQWVRNIVVAGGCTIRWRGADHEVIEPKVIGAGEAAGAFSPFQWRILGAAGVSHFIRLKRTPS